MKNSVLIEFTADWQSFSKGDTYECSRDIAQIHITDLKHAKVYVKQVKKQSKKK